MGARWTQGQLDIYEAKKSGKKPKINTNRLTNQVVEHLNKNGFVVWRQNNVGIFDQKSALEKLLKYIVRLLRFQVQPKEEEIKDIFKKSYRKSNGKLGVTDVIGYEKETGRFIGVEIKTGKDILSPMQIYFLQELNKNNGIAVECRSIEDVYKITST